MKYLTHSLVIFTSILLIETGIISLATWSLPNQIEFALLHNLTFFFELFSSNPSTAVDFLFIYKPVLIIQRIDPLSNSQAWGIYIMPISTITLLTLCLFITWMKHSSSSPRLWFCLFLASILLSVSVFYLRAQACCTVNPAWLLDVILLSRIYNPVLNFDYWQDIYLLIMPWLKTIQLLMASVSLLILYLCFTSSQNNRHKKP